MKAIKIIGLTLVGLIIFALIIGLFIDGNYAVEREVTINKPIQQVFDYVKYLKNQSEYCVWDKKDPVMKKEFIGEDGTVGCISAWDSNMKDVGKGGQKIIKIADGERIDYELHFIKHFEATDYAYMAAEPVSDNQTKVKWGFTGKMKYPMNLMMLTINMEKMLAPALENGLNNLKTNLER